MDGFVSVGLCYKIKLEFGSSGGQQFFIFYVVCYVKIESFWKIGFEIIDRKVKGVEIFRNLILLLVVSYCISKIFININVGWIKMQGCVEEL